MRARPYSKHLNRQSTRILPVKRTMKNRAKQAAALIPALFLWLIWIAAAPSVVAQFSIPTILALAICIAAVSAWSLTAFADAGKGDQN